MKRQTIDSQNVENLQRPPVVLDSTEKYENIWKLLVWVFHLRLNSAVYKQRNRFFW